MNFTNEQLTKAKAAKSAEELLALAKENGIALTEENAKKYFAELHKEGELSEDELDNVAGGKDDELGGRAPMAYSTHADTCPFCNGKFEERNHKYSKLPGEHCGNCVHFTVGYDYNGEENPYGYCEREFH